jgi:hypothetical protein
MIDQIIKDACKEPTLTKALSCVAIWETDRAVRQAARAERSPDGQLYDTCFEFLFNRVLEAYSA